MVFSILVAMSPYVVAAEKKVALMWEGKSGMTKRVHMGFLHRMKSIAPNVEITTKREISDMKEAERVFRDFETTMDGIVFLRSTGAEFLAHANPRIPSFVGGCNNPLYLGAIKNLMAPEDNITGVTYFIPYDKRFQVIKVLFPNVKSVGLLLQKGHPATSIEQEGTRKECERLGIKYNEVLAENSKELIDGAQSLVGKVDLFIISSTGLVMDNTVGLVAVANKSKTPLFSFAEGRAKLGAIAELAADDEKLGAMLADSVVDVVVKGKPISQVPVKMDPDPKIIVNKSIMQAMGLKFPENVLQSAELIQ
jgi:putative tryptophan/tyrosine transport system substrate-binding protein